MSFFYKWTHGLRGKFLLLGAMPLLLLAVLSVYSLKTVNELQAKLNTAYNVRTKLISHVGDMDASIHASGRWVWAIYGLYGDLKDRQKFIQFAKNEIVEFENTMEMYLKLPRNAEITEKFKKVQELWPVVKQGIKEALVHFEKETTEENEMAKKVLQAQVLPNLVPITATFDIINNLMDTILSQEIMITEKQVTASKTILITISLVFSIGFAFFTAYLVRQLVSNLSSLSISLKNSGNQVASASLEIASASEELSQATTEQAASLQETSSSIEEISSMINANTENAKQSSTVSEQSLGTAERGKVVVDHMIKAIGEINTSNTGIMDQINETNKEIENIVTIINEIGNKTKVINDIVFQTKLLSFNASVEAARAGDQGKGFSVVAEEVGNLAAMSGAAALEITNMLEGSIKTVEGIVRDSKDKIGKLILTSKEKVETGTRVAHECEDVLNDIVSSVASVAKMVAEISTASNEQAQGVHEITKAIAQLDQVTQQNTSNSAESANAAGMLSNQAEMLNALVQKLVMTIEGDEQGSSLEHEAPKDHIQERPSATKTSGYSHIAIKKSPKNDLTKSLLPSNNDKRFEDV